MQHEKPPKKLLDQMHEVLQTQHYSIHIENIYLDWVKRYILFDNKRHPAEMGAPNWPNICPRCSPKAK